MDSTPSSIKTGTTPIICLDEEHYILRCSRQGIWKDEEENEKLCSNFREYYAEKCVDYAEKKAALYGNLNN